ncbi:MAG: hypothetical protein FJW63_07935 [Actinobacteria bacterium]|nr:hypothetical protein [Actinomycetota bacterium]
MIKKKVYEYNGDKVRLQLDKNGFVRISCFESCFGWWSREISLYGATLPALRDAIDEFIKLNPR